MTAEGVQQVTQELLDVVPTILSPSQIVDGPLLREIQQLRKLRKIALKTPVQRSSLKKHSRLSKKIKNGNWSSGEALQKSLP